MSRIASMSCFPLVLCVSALLAFVMTPALLLASPEAGVRGYVRDPDLHGDWIVFSSSGDIMKAPAAGGLATRLTSHLGEERYPAVSDDGRWIAFTGEYHGNDDVYVIPFEGGVPRQLTFHGSSDRVVGFAPDGRVIFEANRQPPYSTGELWSVSVDGDMPRQLPFKEGAEIAFDPGGSRVALQPTRSYQVWNEYRGGGADKIWVGNPDLPEFSLVSHHDGNEAFPMWHSGGRIYFVTDLHGRDNLHSMLPDGSDLRQETRFVDFDVRTPRLDGDRIAFLHGFDATILDLATGEITVPDLRLPSDLPTSRTRFIDPADYIDHWDVSPDGKRLIVDARGDIFTLPTKGDGIIRQWTYRSGSRERVPQMLPEADGAVVAITDVSGEDRIVRIDEPGGELVELEKAPLDDWKYFVLPSPDGSMLAYDSGTQHLYIIEVESGKRTLVAEGGWEFNNYSWSPDSRYLAFVLEIGEGERTALRVYDTRTGETHALGDKRFNTAEPTWDPEGRYLYCVSERNFNPYTDYFASSFVYNNTSELALFRLREEVPSPFIARGDEGGEGIPAAPWLGEPGEREDGDAIVIDWEGINDRMVHIPYVGVGNYWGLDAAGDQLYYLEGGRSGINGAEGRDDPSMALNAFDLGSRESSEVAGDIDGYTISTDRSTLVVRSGNAWYVGDAGSASVSLDGDSQVNTSGWEIESNPREEWAQILRESWRKQREFFYDPAMHETDWDDVLARFGPWIERMTTRQDLQDLMREMMAELKVGHAFVGSGDRPYPDENRVGYLGVDMEPDEEHDCFVITQVYNPEPGSKWGSSPLVHSDPLTGPGTRLLAINGRRLTASMNPLRLLQNQAGDEVALLLSDTGDAGDAREVIVETMYGERRLRYYDWTRRLRDYVADRSDGRVAYIHLPDMYEEGMREWGRNYFPYKDRPGMILDDRGNSGGNVSEIIMQTMTSPIFALQSGRHGGLQTKPHSAYHGHVAVLIDGQTFSDGETMAYNTTQLDDWTLIGSRTYGGWIWLWNRRPAVDNSWTIVPEFGGWGLDGEWIIEGPGVAPEIEVVDDPASRILGEDPQLDAAIDHLLERIAADPRELPDMPLRGPYSR